MRIEKKNWTLTDVENALTEIMKFWATSTSTTLDHRRVRMFFSEDVVLAFNGRNKKGSKFILAIFKGNSNPYIYSNRINASVGIPMRYLPVNKLVAIETIDTEVDWARESLKLQRKFHENAWTNIQMKLSDDGSYLRSEMYGRVETLCITPKFPQYVLDELVRAFEEKRNYSYRRPGTKRDISVETKLCDDGIFRAWYSSEFAGCGNGDYWLLINPTTAAFHERD